MTTRGRTGDLSLTASLSSTLSPSEHWEETQSSPSVGIYAARSASKRVVDMMYLGARRTGVAGETTCGAQLADWRLSSFYFYWQR